MLVDIPGTARLDPVISLLFGDRCERLAEGVYEANLNYTNLIDHLTVRHNFTIEGLTVKNTGLPPISTEWGAQASASDMQLALRVRCLTTFGVCDNWEQIVEKYPEILGTSRRLAIFLTEIRKDEQSPQGGWRWHKWGEYIGTHEPQHEYLYDEDGIERVFVYSIVEWKD